MQNIILWLAEINIEKLPDRVDKIVRLEDSVEQATLESRFL